MNRATVVCCFNNRDIFNDMKNSLYAQSEKVDLIGIDNTTGIFKSCSEAYNSVIDDVKTEYIIFSHQDILFEDIECICHFLDYCALIGEYDLLGGIFKC